MRRVFTRPTRVLSHLANCSFRPTMQRRTFFWNKLPQDEYVVTPLMAGKSVNDLVEMRKNRDTKILPEPTNSREREDFSVPIPTTLPSKEEIPRLHLSENDAVKTTKLEGITVATVVSFFFKFPTNLGKRLCCIYISTYVSTRIKTFKHGI
jgi:hypothetical protein